MGGDMWLFATDRSTGNNVLWPLPFLAALLLVATASRSPVTAQLPPSPPSEPPTPPTSRDADWLGAFQRADLLYRLPLMISLSTDSPFATFQLAAVVWNSGSQSVLLVHAVTQQ